MASINETGEPAEVLVRRMVDSHPGRYDERYWETFDNLIRPRLPSEPVIVDLGSGPGLFLGDLTEKLPGALLSGYDHSDTMVDYARSELQAHSAVTLHRQDLVESLPEIPEGSVDLLTMNFFFHYLEWPRPILEFIRTRLDPNHGLLQIYDWVRTPLKDYVGNLPEDATEEQVRSRYERFSRHNRYTFEDLNWLVVDCGFQVVFAERVRTSHAIVLATPRQAGSH